MVTFFSILFILILANGIFMVFNSNLVSEKTFKKLKESSELSESQIYPIDLVSSKFKKAV